MTPTYNTARKQQKAKNQKIKTTQRDAPGAANKYWGSVDGGYGVAAATAQIVHRDVEINLAAGRLDANDHGFGVRASFQAFLVHVNFRRKNFESETAVVEQSDRVSDDHVGELANRFAHHLIALRDG